MFRRLPERGCQAGSARSSFSRVLITVDGVTCQANPVDTVAAAVLVAGIDHLRRTPRSGSPRGLYCGMGVCFDCLVTIDGVPNLQACLTQVRDGMRIVTGDGVPDMAAPRNT